MQDFHVGEKIDIVKASDDEAQDFVLGGGLCCTRKAYYRRMLQVGNHQIVEQEELSSFP